MIFSLSNHTAHDLSFTLENTDIFCFFSTAHAAVLPMEHWHLAVSTSLKMKRNVLVLERPLKQLPDLTMTQRWQIGENFLWLAPRSLSVFLEAHNQISVTYDSIKKTLILSK